MLMNIANKFINQYDSTVLSRDWGDYSTHCQKCCLKKTILKAFYVTKTIFTEYHLTMNIVFKKKENIFRWLDF